MSLWKRGFLEIVSEILDSLKITPLKKSGIVAKCNLDSRACTKYLSVMESLGLITKSKDGSSFSITKKGIDFFTQYENLASIIEKDIEKFNLSNNL